MAYIPPGINPNLEVPLGHSNFFSWVASKSGNEMSAGGKIPAPKADGRLPPRDAQRGFSARRALRRRWAEATAEAIDSRHDMTHKS